MHKSQRFEIFTVLWTRIRDGMIYMIYSSVFFLTQYLYIYIFSSINLVWSQDRPKVALPRIYRRTLAVFPDFGVPDASKAREQGPSHSRRTACRPQ